MQSLQLIHAHLLRRPTNPQTLRLIRLRDHMEVNLNPDQPTPRRPTRPRMAPTYMIHNLMRYAAIVLQHIEVLRAADLRHLLRDGLLSQNDLVSVAPLRDHPGPRNRRSIQHRARDDGFNQRTRTSVRCSSGMSVSFAPWNFGMTSCMAGRGLLAAISFRGVYMLLGDASYCVAAAQRLDVEKSEDFLAFEELEGGDVSWLVFD